MKIILLSPSDLVKLSAEQRTLYQPLIKKEFWCCLEGKDPWDIEEAQIYAATAILPNELPIGIALATFRPNLAWTKLLVLHLLPPYDSDEIFLKLLTTLEESLINLKCETISHLYSSSDPSATQIQRVCQLKGWHPPYLFMIRCFFTAQDFHPPWLEFYRNSPLPKGFQLFKWNQLRESERELLLQQYEGKAFPASISPFTDESSIEVLNSLGLRYKKEIVGWLITRKFDADTINFASLFVFPEFRSSVAPIILLSYAIDLQQKSSVPKAMFELNLQQSDHLWISFVKKRMMPFTAHIERLYEMTHTLYSPEALEFEEFE